MAHSADIGRYENPILGKSLSILGFSASIISSRPYQRKQLIFPFQARIDDEKDYIEQRSTHGCTIKIHGAGIQLQESFSIRRPYRFSGLDKWHQPKGLAEGCCRQRRMSSIRLLVLMEHKASPHSHHARHAKFTSLLRGGSRLAGDRRTRDRDPAPC